MATTKTMFQQRMSFFDNMIQQRSAMNTLLAQNYINRNRYGNYGGCACGGGSSNLSQLILLAALLNGNLGNIGNLDGSGYLDSFNGGASVGTTTDGMGEFANIDSSGNGKISRTEYQNYYMRQRELERGELIDKNHPDYIKYKKEANNLFNALNKNGVITQGRFQRMLNFFDRADGSRDGYIDNNYMKQCLDRIKQNGAGVDILNGKTLSQLVNMEA